MIIFCARSCTLISCCVAILISSPFTFSAFAIAAKAVAVSFTKAGRGWGAGRQDGSPFSRLAIA